MSNKTEKISKQELTLYGPMQKWFIIYLQNKNPNTEVLVHDVHKIYLSDFFAKADFRRNFPDYSTYKIKIDLLGIIKNKKKLELVFIEVKDRSLNVSHVA